jgi:hypothetical protein
MLKGTNREDDTRNEQRPAASPAIQRFIVTAVR